VLLADFSQQPLIGAPQCLSASCGALALACSQQPLIGCRLLPLWCCSHRQSACSQQPFIGCRLLLLPLWCCASLACSHRLAFSSISIINNRSLVRLNVSLPHVVLLLLLAANSRSLVVGCCCCLSGVAATGKALAANSRSLAVGCCCCLSGVALLWLAATGLLSLPFPSLTTAHWCASMSLCLMWCSCSCLQPTAAHWL
jgi:hypothetical protein